MQLENEVYQCILQMMDQDYSRLEIVEACITKYASLYPKFEYHDWSELIKSISRYEDGHIVEDTNETVSVNVPTVVSVSEKYLKAKDNLEHLSLWGKTTPIPMGKWSINGVSKWLKAYEKCMTLCQCLDVDYADGEIDEELYFELTDYISQIEEFTRLLPKDVVREYQNSLLRNSLSNTWNRDKISINEAEYWNFPINIYRQYIGGLHDIVDLTSVMHLVVPEKRYYTRGDLYLERLTRIPELLYDEEMEYFDAYQQGNISARDAIIEATLPSIVALTVKFQHQKNEAEYIPISHRILLEDLVQYAVLIAIESFETYHPSPVYNFKTHALSHIKRQLCNYIAKEELLLSYRRVSIEELINEGIVKPQKEKEQSDQDDVNNQENTKLSERKKGKIKEEKVDFPSSESLRKWNNIFINANKSYRYLWAHAIVQKFSIEDIHVISFDELFDEMIASVWKFSLMENPMLGHADRINTTIQEFKKEYNITDHQCSAKIIHILEKKHNHSLYIKRIKLVLGDLPWNFLGGWIPNFSKQYVNQMSLAYSNECPYSIDKDVIHIHKPWKNYIEANHVSILSDIESSFKTYIRKINEQKPEVIKYITKESLFT